MGSRPPLCQLRDGILLLDWMTFLEGTTVVRRAGRDRSREAGVSLVEMTAAIAIVVVGLTALAGVLLPIQRQRAQATARFQVLGQAQTLSAEIRGAPPQSIAATYDDTRSLVPGITGAQDDGSVLDIQVDSADPRLLVVTIRGTWIVNGAVEQHVIRTEVFNPEG